jgi:hypothetical protein
LSFVHRSHWQPPQQTENGPGRLEKFDLSNRQTSTLTMRANDSRPLLASAASPTGGGSSADTESQSGSLFPLTAWDRMTRTKSIKDIMAEVDLANEAHASGSSTGLKKCLTRWDVRQEFPFGCICPLAHLMNAPGLP